MAALIGITVFVSALRPLAHPSSRFSPQFHGLTRLSLLSESPDTDSGMVPVPIAADARLVEFPVAIGILLFVLRGRSAAFRPLPVQRLKLPARSAERSSVSG